MPAHRSRGVLPVAGFPAKHRGILIRLPRPFFVPAYLLGGSIVSLDGKNDLLFLGDYNVEGVYEAAVTTLDFDTNAGLHNEGIAVVDLFVFRSRHRLLLPPFGTGSFVRALLLARGPSAVCGLVVPIVVGVAVYRRSLRAFPCLTNTIFPQSQRQAYMRCVHFPERYGDASLMTINRPNC